MTQTYYRFHWAACPEFSAENAWSALWGRPRSEDGSKSECGKCGGDGIDYDADNNECGECEGTGWEDAVSGYSACWNADELRAYFCAPGRGEPSDGDGEIIVFEGRQTGTGFDGEPCVTPTRVVARMPWSAL